MKKDTKFLWIYVAILFSFALILILFAGLTSNSKKEFEQQAKESAGIKQSLVTLTDENQNLKDSLKKSESELKTSLENEKNLNAENEIMIEAMGGDEATSRVLLDAYKEFTLGNTEKAKTKIADLNESALTQAQQFIYKKIIGE